MFYNEGVLIYLELKIEYAGFITSFIRVISPQNKCRGYYTKLNLIVKHCLWSCAKCSVAILCHYSQVHTD